MDPLLKIDQIRACHERLASRVRATPAYGWMGPAKDELIGADVEIATKFELLQHTGSFKVRGALNAVLGLSQDALDRGIVTVSSGNHAAATAFAARAVGARAKVVMARTASPVRIGLARHYGAEVVLTEDVVEAFATMEAIVAQEGMTLVHPFDGPSVAQGTGSLALEFHDQSGPFDAMVIPIGGGGLCGGMASAIKQLQPDCEVVGVEPEGADAMRRSFAANEPVKLDRIETIADSLAPPFALPYSFDLCRTNVDDIVLVSDDAIRRAMDWILRGVKLMVEPAAAAAVAALAGPLRGRFDGRRVGVVICGGNIDLATFVRHVSVSSTQPFA
ncbi:pyridoxal-phosphate dependent enzyme [Silanimonas sp.]|jgi:threonine dehydratase|uniref:threonine ammonia-lyase n=1 Tax=Silanimonas sp. TaxID=1929290 RepID=UPI0022C9DFF4|nr:pyridoxal-phosphate dependent enzyme [Silanimonas sp.]MCZ8115492.1 pyridoxal-phosphate dependent enzyme [Silanimonas sp.]